MLGSDAGELGAALFWQPAKPAESTIVKSAMIGCFIFGLMESRTVIISPPEAAGSSGHEPGPRNHAIVDEQGLICANDPFTGGLYALRCTGTVPLN